MVTTPLFRHDRAGTPPESWWSHQGRAGVPDLDLTDRTGVPARRVVVVAAHPDDETLGAGGLLACLARRPEGSRPDVTVVVLTDGEASHPASPTTSAGDLARLRRAECRVALDRLGPGLELVSPGLPDGRLEMLEQDCVATLTGLVGDGRHTVLLAPYRRDGHPDHEAAGRAAAAAAVRTGARLLEYPVWFWHWASPDDAPWQRLRRWSVGREALTAKTRALDAHRSQVAGLSAEPGDEPLLDGRLLAHFLTPQELFVEEAAADPALDRLHRGGEEPWQVPRRWYETRKRDLLTALLPRRRFGSALDVGCSTGVLTSALAERCDRLVAVDDSPAALATARERLRGYPHVVVEQARVPEQLPDGLFDLVVVSELGYFLSPVDLELLVDRVRERLADGGALVLCHWRHPVEGWLLDGPAVHRAFEEALPSQRLASYVDRDVEIVLLGGPGLLPEPTE